MTYKSEREKWEKQEQHLVSSGEGEKKEVGLLCVKICDNNVQIAAVLLEPTISSTGLAYLPRRARFFPVLTELALLALFH